MTTTSLQRVKQVFNGQPSGVVPVAPFAGFYAARIAGVSVRRYVTDGQTIAEIGFSSHTFNGDTV